MRGGERDRERKEGRERPWVYGSTEKGPFAQPGFRESVLEKTMPELEGHASINKSRQAGGAGTRHRATQTARYGRGRAIW